MIQEISIPDIGEFKDVPIVEIFVQVGDEITLDQPILLLESDKATLDIPSPCSGIVREILIAENQTVNIGDVVVRVETSQEDHTSASPPRSHPQTEEKTSKQTHADLVVIGAGPGGYTAAFRAADLGRNVTLIDPRATLGGVCLNVGCIPSKALLHMAKLRRGVDDGMEHGLICSSPKLDLDKVRDFKDGVVGRLTGGLAGLAKRRKVRTIRASATFMGPNTLRLDDAEGSEMSFDQAIIAVGSAPVRLPFLPDDPRIMDSTGALELADVPDRLLVIGGGIIGLEMAQVYSALGSKIDIVEMAEQILPGVDSDIVAPLEARLARAYEAILTSTKVTEVTAGDALAVHFDGPDGPSTRSYDKILVAVGRVPNGAKLDLEKSGINTSGPGFIDVDAQMRSRQPHIFAIGDVVGQPMLAHKAVHEGKVAAEAACGEKAYFDASCIPSVAYTDPEVAWVGLTERAAKEQKTAIKTAKFPWAASGRALSLGRDEGLTKLIFDPVTGKVLGAGIVGPNAGDLIAEATLAIEMGGDAEDIGLTIHPHPTLSETIGLAAETYLGTITDL